MVSEPPTDYGVLDPRLAINSMRSNGYLSTDTALLELIDNSVDAGASTIEVFCFEHKQTLPSGQVRRRVDRIGVLDDGRGMAPGELRRSLRFGGRGDEDPSKIGRFGFGLPNSSISQCNLTEVWSWQNGGTNAFRSYLDVAEISAGQYREVPEPTHSPLPDRVAQLAGDVGDSGSYVEWSELGDGVTWKKGASVIKHTQHLVGRVYRHFLTGDDPLHIILHSVGPDGTIDDSTEVTPNDPLYLMSPTTAPWDTEPMFQEYTSQKFPIEDSKGVKQTVTVSISYSKPECRQIRGGQVAGNQPHGRHAARNQGISIVRNGRELELADVISIDPFRDRWSGVEVHFPSALDELFGVYNNKQGASNLTYYLRQSSKGERTHYDLLDDEEIEQGEPLNELIRLAQWVGNQLRTVMDLVKKQREGTGRPGAEKRHEEGDTPEDRASKQAQRRAESHPTPEEKEEQAEPTPEEDQRRAGVKSLVAQGYQPEDAEHVMSVALDKDRRVLFIESTPSSHSEAIFDVQTLAGARVEVILNINHRAYEALVEILTGSSAEDVPPSELIDRVQRAADNLKMLFAAWARVETEAAIGDERKQIVRVRNAWGRMADDYLRDDDAG